MQESIGGNGAASGMPPSSRPRGAKQAAASQIDPPLMSQLNERSDASVRWTDALDELFRPNLLLDIAASCSDRTGMPSAFCGREVRFWLRELVGGT